MSYKIDGVEPTSISFNGTDLTDLSFNGTSVWGKPFSLSIDAGSNISVIVNRTSSQYQNATLGTLTTGSIVYYGDVLTISATPSSNYKIQTFTVNGTNWTSGNSIEVATSINIVATAVASASWHSVYSGSSNILISYTLATKDFPSVPQIPSGTTKIRVSGQWSANLATKKDFFTNLEIAVANGTGTSSNLGYSDMGLSEFYVLVTNSKLQGKGKAKNTISSRYVFITKVEAYY